MVESLRDEELQRYKESFEKLTRPNLEVYERMPMPGKVMAVLDMRAQFGGKSVIWETAENKRKRREELDAAEEEAAKKARRSLEQPSPSSPPASPVLDGAMIAQIAEMVKASLSDPLDLFDLDEKKKVAEPGSAQQASGPSGAQQGQMDHRVTELEEMKDAAKERRSRIVEKAAEARDADDLE
eukprot:s14031_g1.t1